MKVFWKNLRSIKSNNLSCLSCVRECSGKPTDKCSESGSWRGLAAEHPTEFRDCFILRNDVLNEGTPKTKNHQK